MVETFMMWFASCAMFVAVAWIVERIWNQEDRDIKRGLLLRIARSTCDLCHGGANVRHRLYGGLICDECRDLMAEVSSESPRAGTVRELDKTREVFYQEDGKPLMYL